NASDPHRALFVDLPLAFPGVNPRDLGERLADALTELADAYPRMLHQLRHRTMEALGHQSEAGGSLSERALAGFRLTGDLRVDAFARRLSEFRGTDAEIEALASLALNRPARDWSDRDPDRAALELADLALQFRRAETLARVKGRLPTRHALAVVF